MFWKRHSLHKLFIINFLKGRVGVDQKAVLHPADSRRPEQQEVLHQRAGDEDQATQAVRQEHVPQGREEDTSGSPYYQISQLIFTVLRILFNPHVSRKVQWESGSLLSYRTPTSVAGPGCLSRFPDLNFFHPGSWIRITEFQDFHPNNCFKALRNVNWVVHPGSRSWFFNHPGVKKAPDPRSVRNTEYSVFILLFWQIYNQWISTYEIIK